MVARFQQEEYLLHSALELQHEREIKDRGEPSGHHKQTQNDYTYLFNRFHARSGYRPGV